MARLALLGQQGGNGQTGDSARRGQGAGQESGEEDGEEISEAEEEMKLASYLVKDNPAFGIVTDMGVITLSDRFAGRSLTLKDALAEDEALDELLRLAEGAEPDQSLDGLKYLPLLTNPGKILCVGINYRSHAAE